MGRKLCPHWWVSAHSPPYLKSGSGSEQGVCGPGDVVVIPRDAEHEAWFREDTEVIDFFAPPREDFLLGGKPAYMSEG